MIWEIKTTLDVYDLFSFVFKKRVKVYEVKDILFWCGILKGNNYFISSC